MAVNATCTKCDAPLENDMLTIDDGTQVQISKYPNEHGKKNHHFVVVKICLVRYKYRWKVKYNFSFNSISQIVDNDFTSINNIF
jgi:hypothetical protein